MASSCKHFNKQNYYIKMKNTNIATTDYISKFSDKFRFITPFQEDLGKRVFFCGTHSVHYLHRRVQMLTNQVEMYIDIKKSCFI